jgi:hypothetical protein
MKKKYILLGLAISLLVGISGYFAYKHYAESNLVKHLMENGQYSLETLCASQLIALKINHKTAIKRNHQSLTEWNLYVLYWRFLLS